MEYRLHLRRLIALCLIILSFNSAVRGVEQAAPPAAQTFTVGGAYQLTAPASWISREPRTRIVEHEFAVPAAQGR